MLSGLMTPFLVLLFILYPQSIEDIIVSHKKAVVHNWDLKIKTEEYFCT